MTLISSPSTFLPGVILFCIIHAIYALYIDNKGRHLIASVISLPLFLPILNKAEMLNLGNALGVLDIILALMNAILVWTLVRKRASLLFKTELTLFLCGDLAIMFRALMTGRASILMNPLV